MFFDIFGGASVSYVIASELATRFKHRKDAEHLDRLSSLDCGGIMSNKERLQFRESAWKAIRHIENKNGDPSVYTEHFARCFHQKNQKTQEF